MKGYHFHNSDTSNEGREFIEHTLFHELENGVVQLPDGEGGKLIDVSIKDLGISYPVVVTQPRIRTITFDPDSTDSNASGQSSRMMTSREDRSPRGGTSGTPDQPEQRSWKLRRYDFVIQFCWQPKTRTLRREKAAAPTEAAPGTASAAGAAAPAG
jgi:type IV pilus assembly protein PilM